MRSTEFALTRYDADEGYVFDWKEPRYKITENGEQIQEHLYAVTLFVGETDSIDNYIEIPKINEEKLTEQMAIEETEEGY